MSRSVYASSRQSSPAGRGGRQRCEPGAASLCALGGRGGGDGGSGFAGASIPKPGRGSSSPPTSPTPSSHASGNAPRRASSDDDSPSEPNPAPCLLVPPRVRRFVLRSSAPTGSCRACAATNPARSALWTCGRTAACTRSDTAKSRPPRVAPSRPHASHARVSSADTSKHRFAPHAPPGRRAGRALAAIARRRRTRAGAEAPCARGGLTRRQSGWRS